MHAEQVLKSHFHMGITCSQIMHAEQALKSQFSTDLTCSQIMHAEQVLKSQFHISPAAKSCMLNRFRINFSYGYYL